MIHSGRVLYGDPLTNYANRMLDKLKAVSDDNFDHVQIFTLKSNEVNAFATHQGVIFMTVGLWGQLENETQLAFVLAHELSHVANKHSLLTYQHNKDLEQSTRYNSEKISSYYKYSKNNEEEADIYGFKLAKKAGYNVDELLSTFNVLLYSYLPIDEVALDYSWIENEGFKITEEYVREEPNPISASEDVDDEFHTHPNINNRRESILPLYNAAKKDEEGKIYVAGDQQEFEGLRDLARFQMMHIFIRDADYIEGLYHNRILQKEYPENRFLRNTEAMIWYGMSIFENTDASIPYSRSFSKREGEIQQLYFFLSKLKDKELATVATKQIWENSIAHPEDAFLQKLRIKVLPTLIEGGVKSLDEFSSEYASAKEETEDTVASDKPLSKYDKIVSKRKKETEVTFTYYALVEVMQNMEFIEAFTAAKKKVEEAEANEEEYEEYASKPRESRLNIERMIMSTPTYEKRDSRRSTNKNVETSSTTEQKLATMVIENGNKLGIDIQLIDDFTTFNFSTEQYNEMSLLYEFLSERSQYEDQDFYPYQAQFVSDIRDKYNTDYLGLIDIETDVERREFNAGFALVSALFWPSFPFYLKWQVTSAKNTDYGFVIIDLESNNPIFVNNNFFQSDMDVYLQNAHIYHSLNQITK